MGCTIPSCMVELQAQAPHLPNWSWQGVIVPLVGCATPMASRVMPQLSTPWLFCAYCTAEKTICMAQAWHVLLLCLGLVPAGHYCAIVGGLRHF